MHGSSEGDAFSMGVLRAAVAGNQGLAERVAHAFLTIKPELQSRLSHALQTRDLHTASRAAHELRGMAGMMGARQLALAAAAIEASAENAAAERLAEMQATLVFEWDAVAAALRAPSSGASG